MSVEQRPRSSHKRRGVATIFALFLITLMVVTIALGAEVGRMLNHRSELQRTADSAAMAAVWAYGQALTEGETDAACATAARNSAASFAALNLINGSVPTVDLNLENLATGDIVIGYMADFSNPSAALDTSDPTLFNAIQVRIQRTSERNGEIPFLFGRLLGVDNQALDAVATAALAREIRGFEINTPGQSVGMLPFALDEQTWNQMIAGTATDDWSWDEATQSIISGSDGVLEVNLYPQGTGSPGNRGTVDIGSSNNSTRDISRQILYGVSQADLAFHGGLLEFDENGQLFLNGDTGISAGVKDELEAIKGEPKIVPIFSSVSGNGNNAQYTIVKFVGVRVLEVKLTGAMNQKRVTIQPADVVSGNVLPSYTSSTSKYITSPAILVQ